MTRNRQRPRQALALAQAEDRAGREVLRAAARPKLIHQAEVFQHITLVRGKLRIDASARFLCGEEDGEGSTEAREVTCPACRREAVAQGCRESAPEEPL